MARIPKTTELDPEQDTSQAPVGIDPNAWERESGDVVRVLEEVGEKGKHITLNRYNPVSKKWDHVGRYNLSELEEPGDLLERTKTEHGGGEYRGRIYGNSGFLKHLSFSIDPRFKPAALPPAVGLTAPGISPTEGLGEIKGLLEKLIMLQMSNASRPAQDPLEMMARMSEVMKNLQPPAPVAVQAPAPGVGVKELLDMWKQGMEMGQMASGEGGGSYLPIIERLAPPVVEALNRITGPKAPVKSPTVATAERVNGGSSLKPPTPTTPEQYVQQYLPRIIGLAASGRDPELYADLVLDQVPMEARDTVYAYLDELANRPDALVYLSGLHPGVKEHEEWFANFLTAIRESFSNADSGETTEEVEGVVNGDAASQA